METGQPEINETERRIEFMEEPVVPYSELWHSMRKNKEMLIKIEETFNKKQDKFAVKISECILDLKRSSHDLYGKNNDFDTIRNRLETLLQSFTNALKDFNYQIKIFEGQRLNEIDKNEIEIAGHIENEAIKETVISETITPLIYRNSQVIQRAKVFVCIPPKKNKE